MAEPPKIMLRDIRTSIKAILGDYKKAVENFALGIEISDSSYELMIAKQEYLLAVSGVIKEFSEVYEYKSLSKAATFFEAAARAYLDDSDQRAHYQGSDSRFILNDDISRFLRSRLRMRADQAYRIWALYNRALLYSIDSESSALQFMLDIALELPMDAWDCAPCLAAEGNCRDCGYGRDHRICSHSGSTYEMLSLSSGYIIKSIRVGLTETRIQPDIGQEDNLCSSEPKDIFFDRGEDPYEGSEAVDLCDLS